MLKNLLLQMIAYHSYNELKVILVTDEEHAKEWEFIRYIPHFWNKDRSGNWTSNNNGTHSKVCSECQNTVTENCSYRSTVTQPTAAEQGYTTHTCTVCGYSYTG